MAVLEKIRVKFGLAISIIIALALLSFIIDPSTLQTVAQSMSSKNDVGKIAGKSISYNDYMSEVDNCKIVYETMSNNPDIPEEYLREMAWNNLCDKYLHVKNAKAAGINVSKAEVADLMSKDESLVALARSIEGDPSGRLRLCWNFAQDGYSNGQYREKYNALFANSSYKTSLEMEADSLMFNTKTTVDYAMLRYPAQKDSSIVIGTKEAKAYYKAHKKMNKQVNNRDIEYVYFEATPSESDIASARKSVEDVMEEFKTREDIKAFIAENSDEKYTGRWYEDEELYSISSGVADFVAAGNEGVSDIFEEDNSFVAARVIGSAMVPDQVYVKRILITGDNAKHVADSLAEEIGKGSAFDDLAVLYNDPESNAPWDLQWMNQDNLPQAGIESSYITSKVGEPFVVSGEQYALVVLFTEQSDPVEKKQVAILKRTAVPGTATLSEYYSKASRFVTEAAGTYEGYKKAVESLGEPNHVENIDESRSVFCDIDNAKAVTRWVFDAKKNKVSDVITVNQKYFFVATLTGIHKEGYKTFDEMSESIGQTLYAEALHAKVKDEVAGKIAGKTSIEEVAQALGVVPDKDQDATIPASVYGGSRIDKAALGAMYVAPEGVISGPVAGDNGVYVFKVNSHEMESTYTKENIKNTDMNERVYGGVRVLYGVNGVMWRNSDSKDNRARFF